MSDSTTRSVHELQGFEGDDAFSLLHDTDESVPAYRYQIGPTLIRMLSSWNEEDLRSVETASFLKPEPVREALGGRATLIRCQVKNSEEQRVVLKSYRRGGMFRKLLPAGLFLGFGEERSQRELRALLSAKALGISVPEPLGTLVRGDLVKREWLIMKEFGPHRSLATLGREIEEKKADFPLEECIQEVVRQLELLIDQRMLHVDLHPGNVVVTDEGQVFIIDFDHATKTSDSRKELRERYIRRWRRAVIKHELPEILSEIFCSLLRRKRESSWEDQEEGSK